MKMLHIRGNKPMKMLRTLAVLTVAFIAALHVNAFVLPLISEAAAQTLGPVPLAFTPEQVINVTDYGAACNGTTDDTAAINAAFAAARTSAVYTGGGVIQVSGPMGLSQNGCAVTSVNATGFTLLIPSRLIISGLTLICSGAGNVCLDESGSRNIVERDVIISGASSPMPEVGLLKGNLNPPSIACCVHEQFAVQVSGSFSFAAYQNAAAESVSHFGSIFSNSNTTLGPILTLGSITGGSSYTNGTYTNVPLTGGTCAQTLNGIDTRPLATIVVSGNAVSSVTVTFQGRDCTAGDTLSAVAANIGGTGSGFSVPVTAIVSYGTVLDGQNHWRANSAYQTYLWTPDTHASFSQGRFFAGSMRHGGAGVPLWIADAYQPILDGTYFLATTGPYDVVIFDNGVGSVVQPRFSTQTESPTLSSAFFFTGSNATPTVTGFYHRDNYPESNVSEFAVDTNITTLTLPDADVRIVSGAHPTTIKMFDDATKYAVSGDFYVPTGSQWNYPASFSGCITIGTTRKCTPSYFGPLDVFSTSVSAAYSCSRVLRATYTGPLCTIVNATTSGAMDLYPDANGIANAGALSAFLAGAAGHVSVMYEQSGSGAPNALQTTDASRPIVVLQDSTLNARISTTYGDTSAIAMSVAANAAITDIWSIGGFGTLVMKQVTSTVAGRYASKASAPTGWEWRITAFTPGTRNPAFTQNATTTNGSWDDVTSPTNNAGHVFDVAYSSASLANVAVMSIDGVSGSLTNVTQPVGTINSDSALAIIIGNNSGANRGLPGNLAEIIFWKSQPNAQQLDAIRRSQGAFYGLTAVK